MEKMSFFVNVIQHDFGMGKINGVFDLPSDFFGGAAIQQPCMDLFCKGNLIPWDDSGITFDVIPTSSLDY
jgi:hypothetical protein